MTMDKYPKIQSIFKRDEKTFKFIEGQYSLPEFELLKDIDWVWTEKVDGTNIRIKWTKGNRVMFGGRTDNASIPTFLIAKLQELFPQEIFEKNITKTDTLCLFGEGYGAKIQKGGGKYNPNGVDFVLFDVKVDDWWLKREDVCEIADYLNIKTVPIIKIGTLQQSIEFAKSGYKSNWGDFEAEGIVLKPKIDLFNRKGNRIITKVKHKDF